MESHQRLDEDLFELYDEYCHGNMSRRDFLERASAIGAAVGLAGVAGCRAREMLPDYGKAERIAFTDERIKPTYATFDSPGGNSGGRSFDLEFTDPLFDLYGMPGLYRATLEDEGGRRWRLWRFDGLNTGDNRARIHVPDLAAGGGSGLGDGTIRATLAVFGVPGLVPTEFLWSDLAREHEHFSEAAQVTFQQP